MIVDETGEVQQSIEDILRNNCFKIPRTHMLRSSVSVDMKVYALQLKQKSTADVFTEFCKLFLGGLLLKRKQRRGRAGSDACGFRFSLFPRKLFLSYETIFFLHKFLHSEAFQFRLYYPSII